MTFFKRPPCSVSVRALLLALCICLSAGLFCMGAIADAATPADEIEVIDRYFHDFEGTTLSDTFSDNTAGFGMSYAGGVRAQAVSGDAAIEGRSVRLSNADLRWWNVGYTGLSFGFSVDILCDDGFKDTSLDWCAQNHIASTSTESFNGGRVITVKADESGEPAVYNHEGEKLVTITRGHPTTLTAVFVYGEPGYRLYMDGKRLSEGNRFAEDSAFFSVQGLNMSVQSRTETSYITVDNIRAYVEGKKYPQPNSYQTPGELPTITLPDALNTDGVMIYANDTYLTMVPSPATEDAAPLLPLSETLAGFGASATTLPSGNVRIETATATYILTADGDALLWNDETVTLHTPAAVVDGVVYAPAQVFAEVTGAKVWYSEALGMVVLSTGDFCTDNVLRSIGGSFWMNGEPYYEISFNKWDLSVQIASDASFNGGEYTNRSWCTPETTLAGAERALKELSENGFRTIRIFASNVNPGRGQEAIDRLFAHTDLMYDLCDQYGIRVIPCLGLMDQEFLDGRHVEGIGWVPSTETHCDLITDPESKSRAWVYAFIDLYINRYKDRDTILMWEIQNEGNLGADVASGVDATYSIGQLGDYYADMAARIKANDPTRMVTGGDSLLRSAQWHLYAGVMAGMEGHDWSIDKDFERLYALWTINHGVDTVSVHGYGVGYENDSGHAYYLASKANRYLQKIVDWKLLMSEARRMGMPLYNGECGGMIDDNGKEISADNASPEAAEARVRYLNALVDAGVQLTHWWAFNSDRVDFGFDMDTWNVTIKDTPETFAAIKAANEALQARYMVNPLAADNTHALSDKTGNGALTEPETPPETLPDTLPDTQPETTEPIGTQPESETESAASTETNAPAADTNGCGSRLEIGVSVWIVLAGVAVSLCNTRRRCTVSKK